jgi:KRAB domain-containing zinc finger protein
VHFQAAQHLLMYSIMYSIQQFSRPSQTFHNSIQWNSSRTRCAQTPVSFARKGHLRTRARVHSGEKPFDCSCRTKSFACSGQLKRHVRVHTGVRNLTNAPSVPSFISAHVFEKIVLYHTNSL